MASTSSKTETIQFSVDWKIKWSEFFRLSLTGEIRKAFITSYNNIPLCWVVKLVKWYCDPGHIALCLDYQDGPVEKFNDMQLIMSIMKSDLSTAITIESSSYEAKRGSFYCGTNCLMENSLTFRSVYGLQESDELITRITLEIPISVFSYSPNASPSPGPQNWFSDLFVDIEKPESAVQLWDLKLISRDGAEFFCHQMVIYRCEPLKSICLHPPPIGQQENSHVFPNLGTPSLKAPLQFLYTSHLYLWNLTTTDLIELTYAAEMYNLEQLKECCVASLWKKAVKYPESCGEILRFATLHHDLKYLKHRVMDVLAKNFQTEASVFGDGWRGDLLREDSIYFPPSVWNQLIQIRIWIAKE